MTGFTYAWVETRVGDATPSSQRNAVYAMTEPKTTRYARAASERTLTKAG
jgi:hypothetical protein